MLKSITYKKKVTYLIITSIVGLIFIYNLAIKETLKLKKECKTTEQRLAKVKSAPEQIASITKQLNEIDRLVGKSYDSEIDIQESLFDEISKYCERNYIYIREFPEVHLFQQQDFSVETNEITVEGSYIKLLKLLYAIENEYGLGKVISTNFLANEDFRSKRRYLTVTIYIQNIKSIKNDT